MPRSTGPASSALDEAIAGVAVVIDPVPPLQLLDEPQRRLRVRAGDAVTERLARVEQDRLEAAAEAHALVRGEVVEQGGQTFLQAHRDIRSLDLEGRPRVQQMMAEHQPVSIEISNRVVAEPPGPVL